MEEQKIGFDIDGVLANFLKTFFNEYVNPHVGRKVSPSQINHWNFYKCIEGLTKEAQNELFIKASSEGIMERLEVLDNGIVPVLRTTAERIPVAYITQRHQSTFSQTYQWFMNNNIPFGHGIYFTHEDKITKQVLANKLNMVAFVEDSLHNANNIAEVCPNVFLYDRRYNKGRISHNVHRFRSGKELERLLEPTIRVQEKR